MRACALDDTSLSTPADITCADIMYQVNHLIKVLALAVLVVAVMILVVFKVA